MLGILSTMWSIRLLWPSICRSLKLLFFNSLLIPVFHQTWHSWVLSLFSIQQGRSTPFSGPGFFQYLSPNCFLFARKLLKIVTHWLSSPVTFAVICLNVYISLTERSEMERTQGHPVISVPLWTKNLLCPFKLPYS